MSRRGISASVKGERHMTRDRETDRVWLVSSLRGANQRCGELPKSIQSSAFSASARHESRSVRAGSDRR